MRICTVLGNGPSLDKSLIHGTPIGVNRSYERIWAPIWVTADSDALEALIHRTDKPPYYLALRADRAAGGYFFVLPFSATLDVWRHTESNRDVATSGLFGLHVALGMRFEQIYLLGFDHDTTDKFNKKMPEDAGLKSQASHQVDVIHKMAVRYPRVIRWWNRLSEKYESLP